MQLRVWTEDWCAATGDPDGVLTDEHTASSYGLPVLLLGGQVYGPADLPPGTRLCVAYESGAQLESRRLPGPMAFVARARAAGYEVED